MQPFQSKDPASERPIPTDPALLEEAKKNPNGWVYVVDRAPHSNGPIYPESIIGAWRVGPDGKLTGEYSPNRNYGHPRRGIIWFSLVAMLIFTGFMALFFDQRGWDQKATIFVTVSGAFTFGLLVFAVDRQKYWWGLRLVTSIIFALYFWYLIDETFLKGESLKVTGPADESVFNAIRGFLFFGLPSLLYTLWGSPWGKLGRPEATNVTPADVVTFKIAVWARWLFLALTLLVVILAFARNQW